MTYDPNNIFAKILRGEIPCEKVYEDDHNLAFKDIDPAAKVHVLVIPKGSYTDFSDFAQNASDIEITSYAKAIQKTAAICNVEENGYRTISNRGEHSNQEVPHLHMHIVGGEMLKSWK